MFRPPQKTDTGAVQLRQYARWIEGTLEDVTLLDDDDDDVNDGSSLPSFQIIRGARRLCDRLRDGNVLLRLANVVGQNVVDTSLSSATLPPSSTLSSSSSTLQRSQQAHSRSSSSSSTSSLRPPPAGAFSAPMHSTVRALTAFRQRLLDVLLSAVVQAGLSTSGIDPNFVVRTERDVPSVERLYSGNFEALSFVLFHLFHTAVVRERWMLAPTMARWYNDMAEAYGLGGGHDAVSALTHLSSGDRSRLALVDPTLSASMSGPGSSSFDQVFGDGLLWICAMHHRAACAEVDVDLSTVYYAPASPTELVANVSFAYCLMELHGVFCYFSNLGDFLERRNSHFVFLQSFAVYQACCSAGGSGPVRPLGKSLRFADDARRLSRPTSCRHRFDVAGSSGGGRSPLMRGGSSVVVAESTPPSMTPQRRAVLSPSGSARVASPTTLRRTVATSALSVTDAARKTNKTIVAASRGRVAKLVRSIAAQETRRADDTVVPTQQQSDVITTAPTADVEERANLEPIGECWVACRLGADQSLVLQPFDAHFDGRRDLVFLTSSCKPPEACRRSGSAEPAPSLPPRYSLPLPAMDRFTVAEQRCSDTARTAVTLQFTTSVPTAPAPYHRYTAPCVTLFFSRREAAVRLQALLQCAKNKSSRAADAPPLS